MDSTFAVAGDESSAERRSDAEPTTSSSDGPESTGSELGADLPRRSRHRIRARILLGLGIVTLFAAGWVSYKAVQAYQHLSEARSVVNQLQHELDEHGISRPQHLTDLADRLRSEANAARDATQDPIYRAARVIPWVGSNLQAVGHLSAAIDLLAEPLPSGANLAARVAEPGLLHDGGIDVDTVRSAAGFLSRLDAAVQGAQHQLAAIDRGMLISQVSAPVLQLDGLLPSLAELSETGVRIGDLALPMLGADAPRTYLVVFQNPAEPRATGGIFGSYLTLNIDAGRISISGQGSASRDIGPFDSPQGAVDAHTRDLYTELIATYPMNVNFTPDFPAAAERFRDMYTARIGGQVDGVIAIDPVVISTLMQGRPPVELPDGTELTSASITDFLLSDIYAKFPTGEDADRRDLYLAGATSTVFNAVISGGGDLGTLVDGLREMIDQRRVLIWSADPQEQRNLAATAVAGSLGADPVEQPSVGVFLNDGTGTKLGYYLKARSELAPGSCRAGGERSLYLTTTIENTSPDSGLPDYVLADRPAGSDAYRQQLNVLLVAPDGGRIDTFRIDGEEVPVLSGTDHGRAVSMLTVTLDPGDSVTVTATVSAPPLPVGSTARPKVVTTPLAKHWPATTTAAYPACI